MIVNKCMPRLDIPFYNLNNNSSDPGQRGGVEILSYIAYMGFATE